MIRFAVLLLVMTAGVVAATAESFRVSDIDPGDTLSIREFPDGEAATIGRIPWNERRIRGFGCTNETPSGRTWCRVKHAPVVGWARRRYLQPE
jgi:uncharacterized protein YraI